MKKPIEEYYTASHHTPLVIVPIMGLLYFKGESRGYHIRSRFLEQIVLILDDATTKGEDLRVAYPPFPGNELLLSTSSPTGFCISTFPVWEMDWTKWWKSLIKIQKRLKYVLWKKHRPPLELIKAFQGTDRAKTIPSDIASQIIHAYFEPLPQIKYEK